jgi:WhiB family redox-sensing transcriptional regulator
MSFSEEWVHAGACVGKNPDQFDSTDFPIIREAKKVCATCPVINSCLASALEIDPTNDYGVLGGTTPLERRKLRKQSPKPKSQYCGRGHEFTGENTYLNARGTRICRACKRIPNRRRA